MRRDATRCDVTRRCGAYDEMGSDLGDLGEQWCFERVQLAVCLLGSVSRPFKLCQSDGGSAQGSIRFGSATADP